MQSTSPTQLYSNRFKDQQQSLRTGPADPTQCRDIAFFFIFCFLVLSFAGIGIYYICISPDAISKSLAKGIDNFKSPLTIIQKVLVKYWYIIICVFFLSGILSSTFLILMRIHTHFMVDLMIILSFLLLVAVVIISVINQYWGVVAGFGSAILLMLITLFCLRSSIKRGIALLSLCMQCMSNRPSITMIPTFMLLPSLSFLIFWTVSLLSMQYNAYNKQNALSESNSQLKYQFSAVLPSIEISTALESVFYAFWIFMFGFMTIFLYYVMVYLMANCCGFWYYGKPQLGFLQGLLKLNRYHIGSLTFATIIISFVRLFKKLTQNCVTKQVGEGNSCLAMCLCCASCLITQIEQVIEVLNNYTIITMTITGQSYLQSAKTAVGLIYQQFQLFYISSIVSQLVQICGIVFSAGVPTLLGWIFIQKYENNGSIDNYERIMIVVVIFFLCLSISLLFISFLSEFVSMIFIFYCLDKKYRNIGVTLENSPEILHHIDFNEQLKQKKQIAPISADRFQSNL